MTNDSEKKGVLIVLTVLIIVLGIVAIGLVLYSSGSLDNLLSAFSAEKEAETNKNMQLVETSSTTAKENEPEIIYEEQTITHDVYELTSNGLTVTVKPEAKWISIKFNELRDPTQKNGTKIMFSCKADEMAYRAQVDALVKQGSKDVPSSEQIDSCSFANYFKFENENEVVSYTITGNLLKVQLKNKLEGNFEFIGREDMWSGLTFMFNTTTTEEEITTSSVEKCPEDEVTSAKSDNTAKKQ